jgi:hypothetical protein
LQDAILTGKYDVRPAKMKREKTDVWTALCDGEIKSVAVTPDFLWKEVRSGGWYRPTQKDRWTFIVRTRSLPVASGEVHDWSKEGGRGGIKIHWECPVCHRPHWSDKDPEEPNPTIWFCEDGGHKPVLIHWKDKKAGRTRRRT